MDRETLSEIGKALYGEQWQSPLSRDLAVSDRTMRRWIAGEFALPDGLAAEAKSLLRARIGRLRAVAKLLR